MPLDDADRSKLEEIERRLAQDHPDIAAVLRDPDRRVRRPIAVTAVGAVAVFVGALAAQSGMVGNPVPVLLALPPAAAVLALLRWPDFARLPPAKSDGSGPGRAATRPPWWS